MTGRPAAVTRVVEAAASHPAVHRVELIGSRAVGDPTALSDWDFALAAPDAASAVDDLPARIRATGPLALFWDPLSTRRNLVVVVDGPHKVDLILDVPHRPRPPWTAGPDTLAAIDQHFWDWVLWLGSKHLRGRRELVTSELVKLTNHLLRPLGLADRPATIEEAVRAYTTAERPGVDGELGRQVARALAATGVITPR